MAIKDFNEYVYKVNEQVIAAKEDLKEFEKCLKDGLITEDKLQEVKEEYNVLDTNLQRLLWCSYLLSIPNRDSKKAKYKKANKKLEKNLKENKADDSSIIYENKCALDILRQDLKKLKTEIEEEKHD